MIKIAVCGATGYTGFELVKILLKHPEVEITALGAKIDSPSELSSIFPEIKGRTDAVCKDMTAEEVISTGAEIVFLALPHKVSMEFAPTLLNKNIKVIDLSADFRLKDAMTYEKYYQHKHSCVHLLKESVYGIPEIYKEDIKNAKLIANPGCFPTGAILSLAPLVLKIADDISEIIIDAKTGTTGAGRKASLELLLAETAENIKAYKIGVHQHTPEINQELSRLSDRKIEVFFCPHLIPIKRGILTTSYIKTKGNYSTKDALGIFRDFYKDAPFVRVYDEGTFPQVKDVVYTNYCDIGIFSKGNIIVVVSCIDNLLKGASGQAVQNMNIACGFKEDLALI